MNRVIVTGGNGFIGRHLVKKLIASKTNSIVIISNSPSIDGISNSPSIDGYSADRRSLRSPLRSYTADIRDENRLLKIFRDEKAETCIHLAAKISVSDSIRNPDETTDINVNGTANVLEACQRSGVKNFVFASSAAVYGDVAELPISEDRMLRPLSPYGTSKMLAEQHVSSFARLKKIENAISLRIFNVYGPGQATESDVITKFVKRLSNQMPPIIYGDGSHTRDFISVDDVVDALIMSIRKMERSGDYHNGRFNSPAVFNVGTGIPTSINDLARKMIDMFGLDLEPIYKPLTDSSVILHSYADITKAKELLNFVPKFGIDDGLREIVKTANSSK